MQWSGEAIIGFNAAEEYYETHPHSGTLQANAVDCVHAEQGGRVNNVIFDLVREGSHGSINIHRHGKCTYGICLLYTSDAADE